MVRGQSWAYDAVGNTAQLVSDGVPQARAHNYQNEITALMTGLPVSPPTPVGGNATMSTPQYDSSGNMTGDEAGRSFTFDGWNRLVSVQDQTGTQKTYGYDGLNRRVTETTGGTTTDLYYSAWWQILEEQVGTDTTKRYVWSPVYVDAMVLRDRDTTGDGTLDERLWVQQDANWNVTALVDGSGVEERYVYGPYGVVTIYSPDYSTMRVSSSYAMNYLFQGMRQDATSGQYASNRRGYSPTLQRWTSIDPSDFFGNDINLYRAFANNPLQYVDPSGLAFKIPMKDVGTSDERAAGNMKLLAILGATASGATCEELAQAIKDLNTSIRNRLLKQEKFNDYEEGHDVRIAAEGALRTILVKWQIDNGCFDDKDSTKPNAGVAAKPLGQIAGNTGKIPNLPSGKKKPPTNLTLPGRPSVIACHSTDIPGQGIIGSGAFNLTPGIIGLGASGATSLFGSQPATPPVLPVQTAPAAKPTPFRLPKAAGPVFPVFPDFLLPGYDGPAMIVPRPRP